LEQLFPGFTESMVARGGMLGDMLADIAFDAGRRRFARSVSGRRALCVSRLAIEAELRQRVLARPGVRALTGVEILPPLHDRGRVGAARYRACQDGGTAPEQLLPAALVIDCTGRGSRAPQWLAAWGYEAPHEERVHIGICYTSATFARTGNCAMGPGLERVAAFGAVTNEQPRPGVLLAHEPDAQGTPRWVAAVGGFAGDHAPATLQALRERALDIGSPDLVKVTHEAEPIGDVMRYRMPHSQRRRYERLRRVPGAFLVMGDAIASFNPIYGQGMTVAACESLVLRQHLAGGREPAPKAFFRDVGKVVDIPWQLAVGGDLAIDRVPGHRPLPLRIVNAYVARILRAAPRDAVVSAAFQSVVHMVKQPASLFAPRLLWRVLLKGGPYPASAQETGPASLQQRANHA
jgi:2-polyprenyl-6-methoxyphenol hydroxylase-like FAD-dependent oxidoreductase